MSEEIKKYKSSKDVNRFEKQEKKAPNVESKKNNELKSEKKLELKPEPEEKIIFRFNKSLINKEKEIHNKDKYKKVTIDIIQIKNISRKEYNSALMSWF